MLVTRHIQCPYCGERIDIVVDASAGDQRYIEDCQVCCRPISIEVWIDADEQVRVSVSGEDEA
ncbi:CPXCG motif-containing cysteine-rich protein [Dyella flava]|uniref:CPXCG motif-containing cysteine-rich protein n=1 Tax=Dyella flava TaxID=1920170 RepID=A0ABS2JYE5_9GAMM|nr:CPXCG motif-containing cysteine-rich protein [Dyella flava]MBM7123879.1 CPXCG motif-containing cysteine-rich protein [Dyella flava]